MLELQDIGRRFEVAGEVVTVLEGISLALAAGSLTSIVGRSGCGKTTLLRLVAGLLPPSQGGIRFTGARPRIGVVFQEPRLMPWLTVEDNVAFGLRRRLDKVTIKTRVGELLDLVGLAAFRRARPDQLSGGMAQRVALARALALRPDLLLLDEPFSALDAFTRRALQNELAAIWQAHRPTILFVTHDVEEAVLLGQTVIELERGRLAHRHVIDLPHLRDPTDPAVAAHRRAILANLLGPTSSIMENAA